MSVEPSVHFTVCVGPAGSTRFVVHQPDVLADASPYERATSQQPGRRTVVTTGRSVGIGHQLDPNGGGRSGPFRRGLQWTFDTVLPDDG